MHRNAYNTLFGVALIARYACKGVNGRLLFPAILFKAHGEMNV